MEVSSGLGVVVCPVVVKLFWSKTLLPIVEEFNVIHSFKVLGACLLVCEGAAFCGCCWFGSIVLPRLGRLGS